MHNLLQGIEFNKNRIEKYNKFYEILFIFNGDFGGIFLKSPKRDET